VNEHAVRDMSKMRALVFNVRPRGRGRERACLVTCSCTVLCSDTKRCVGVQSVQKYLGQAARKRCV
jgi:hypothetical protein